MELPPRVAAGAKQWVPEEKWLLRHKFGSGDVPVTSRVTSVTADTREGVGSGRGGKRRQRQKQRKK